MAIKEWNHQPAKMLKDATEALGRLARGEIADRREVARPAAITATQIPPLLAYRLLKPGRMSGAALAACQTVGSISAGWDELDESAATFAAGLDERELTMLVEAVPTWARSVITEMLHLQEPARRALLGGEAQV